MCCMRICIRTVATAAVRGPQIRSVDSKYDKCITTKVQTIALLEYIAAVVCVCVSVRARF